MKKVYFACSIRGGRDDAAWYAELVAMLRQHCQVLTEVFSDTTLTAQGMNKPSEVIWQTDTNWLREADMMIAEVTTPSLGVGYEIATAEAWGKPVLALYRPTPDKKLSAMIAGSPATQVANCTSLVEAETAVVAFLAGVAEPVKA